MLPPPSTPRGDDRWRARRGTARSARRGRCRLTPERVAAELRMPRNTPQTADASSAVAFEVDRFAWTASDRIEVTGRWFGLRGHRFMRPALFVEAGDDRRRLLALLEHKPWAGDEGEPGRGGVAGGGGPGRRAGRGARGRADRRGRAAGPGHAGQPLARIAAARGRRA